MTLCHFLHHTICWQVTKLKFPQHVSWMVCWWHKIVHFSRNSLYCSIDIKEQALISRNFFVCLCSKSLWGSIPLSEKTISQNDFSLRQKNIPSSSSHFSWHAVLFFKVFSQIIMTAHGNFNFFVPRNVMPTVTKCEQSIINFAMPGPPVDAHLAFISCSALLCAFQVPEFKHELSFLQCNGIENDHWEWPQLVSCSTKPLSLLMVCSTIMGEVFVACNLQDVPNPGWKWNCHFGMSTMSSFDACVMCMSSVLCILDLLWETGPLLGSQKSIHPCHWTRHH